MKYSGTLIAVSNMAKSKELYETILGQKILMDIGVHVTFENGLSLQENYSELVGEDLPVHKQSNNFQLYFEVEDIETWYNKIQNIDEIEMVHGLKEYPWGQRVIRFYDFDKHIIEVAESMESVVKRLLKQGISIEETAERTMFPIEFVQQFM